MLEVEVVIDKQLAAGRSMANNISIIAAIAAALVVIMALSAARTVATPVKRMT